jgi:small GTP-binding protein
MKEKETDKIVNILFVGSSGVGKTSYIEKMTKGRYVEDIPITIGVSFKPFEYVHPQKGKFQLHIWECGGGKFQNFDMMNSFFGNIDVIVLMFDLTDLSSIRDSYVFLDYFEKKVTKKIPVLITGNKIDKIKKNKEIFEMYSLPISAKSFYNCHLLIIEIIESYITSMNKKKINDIT